MFDTHCHPHLNKIKNSHKVIWEFFQNGGKYMNIIGTDITTCKEVIQLSSLHPNIYCSIGIHPCDINNLDLEETIKLLWTLYHQNFKKIIAIWESGLDYHWVKIDAENRFANNKNLAEKYIQQIIALQKVFFRAHILLARTLDLPLVIHNRNAKEDVFEILQDMNFKNFIFHCYSEDLKYAQKLISFAPNCKISFSGIVTFKNATDIQEAAKHIPLKNIICETDAPYLTPIPLRGKEENEPLYTQYTIDFIAKLRWEDKEYIQQQIFKNSCDMFWLKNSFQD